MITCNPEQQCIYTACVAKSVFADLNEFDISFAVQGKISAFAVLRNYVDNPLDRLRFAAHHVYVRGQSYGGSCKKPLGFDLFSAWIILLFSCENCINIIQTPESCSHMSPPSPSGNYSFLETDFTQRYCRKNSQ